MRVTDEKPDTKAGSDSALMPLGVRRWVLGGLGALLVSALYLIAVRGPAILFDLSAAVAALCF